MTSPATEWSAGARAAGLVITLGYLLGLVTGPVVAVVGGLALVTLGRSAAGSAPGDLALSGSLAVLAGALGVGALRWGALDLGEVRGIQAVLGPTVLVGPGPAAAACAAAAIAAIVALGCWLTAALRQDVRGPVPGPGWSARVPRVAWVLEGFVGGLAVVTVFWGPSIPRGAGSGRLLGSLATWVFTAAAAGGAGLALALWLNRRPGTWTWVALAVSGVAVLASAGVIASEL